MPVLLRPGHEGVRGELKAAVGAHRTRIAAEAGRLVEHTRHVLAAHAMVDRDVHALVAGEAKHCNGSGART